MSLVSYPEALCIQAWTQVNLMPVFNETFLQLLAMKVSQIFSLLFLPMAWDKSRPEVRVI
jgi:hypothetical protein